MISARYSRSEKIQNCQNTLSISHISQKKKDFDLLQWFRVDLKIPKYPFDVAYFAKKNRSIAVARVDSKNAKIPFRFRKFRKKKGFLGSL